jgi:hypothetical protein
MSPNKNGQRPKRRIPANEMRKEKLCRIVVRCRKRATRLNSGVLE